MVVKLEKGDIGELNWLFAQIPIGHQMTVVQIQKLLNRCEVKEPNKILNNEPEKP
jgi:hypothetical protein